MNKIMHDSEVLKEGQQVITACGFIWAEFDGVKKVFLAKRAATKKFLPSVYELPGGHVDFGDQVEVGLAREIHEEFGMTVRVDEPFGVFTYVNDIKKSHSVEIVYFAQFTDSLENITIHPEDHESFGWFAEDELSDHVYSEAKPADDQEMQLVRKGFAMLAQAG